MGRRIDRIQVIRACLADDGGEQRAPILSLETVQQVPQDIAQLLPELRPAHTPTPRPLGPQPNAPEQARFQLFESVVTLRKNVARIGPLVIAIDVLHDGDYPSFLLLKFIAGHSKDPRILLLGTYRDTEVTQSQELAWLNGDLTREGQSLPILGLSEPGRLASWSRASQERKRIRGWLQICIKPQMATRCWLTGSCDCFWPKAGSTGQERAIRSRSPKECRSRFGGGW